MSSSDEPPKKKRKIAKIVDRQNTGETIKIHSNKPCLAMAEGSLNKEQQDGEEMQEEQNLDAGKSKHINANEMSNDQKEDDSDNDIDSNDNSEMSDTDSDIHLHGHLSVHVGDVLNQRYVIQDKLGSGTFSTVWLAMDNMSTKSDKRGRFVALKIQKCALPYYQMAKKEVKFLTATRKDDKNNDTKNDNPQEKKHIVQLLDSFQVKAKHGDFRM